MGVAICSCGCELTTEELYKVDKTALADILGVSVVSSCSDDREESEAVGDEEEESEEEDKGTVELEEILRACDQVQDKAKGDDDKKDALGGCTCHHVTITRPLDVRYWASV